MKFTIVIHDAPYRTPAARSALRFCRALLGQGHEIYRLFFFRDGVHNLSPLAVVPQDEMDLFAGWQLLIREHGIDTVACVTSALKRGVIDSQEATRYEKDCTNMAETATIGGLGQLVDATLQSDRVLNFG